MIISAPVPQSGTLGPAIVTLDDTMTTLEDAGTLGLYTLWAGTAEIDAVVTGDVMLEAIFADAVVDRYFLEF